MIRIVHVYGLLVNYYCIEETPSKGVGRREKKGGSVGRRNWREGSKNEGGRMKVQFILPSPGEHVDP